jgi:hypothetical protein
MQIQWNWQRQMASAVSLGTKTVLGYGDPLNYWSASQRRALWELYFSFIILELALGAMVFSHLACGTRFGWLSFSIWGNRCSFSPFSAARIEIVLVAVILVIHREAQVTTREYIAEAVNRRIN